MSESSDAHLKVPLGATFHYREIPVEERKPAPGMEEWAVKAMGVATFGRVLQMTQEMMAQAQAENSGQTPPVSATIVQYASKETFEKAMVNVLTEKPRTEAMDRQSLVAALDKMGKDIQFLLERAERQETDRRAVDGDRAE